MQIYKHRVFTFPPVFADSIKMLGYYKNEVGGGIILDKKKTAIVKIVIFPSDLKFKVAFDNTKYDIEFHTHPVVSNKMDDIVYARIPSPADIANTFTTGVEEIVFVRNYTFSISIYDKIAFENAKRRIRTAMKNEKHDYIFDRYRAYFTMLFDGITKTSKRVDGRKRVRMIASRWKRALKKHGLIVQKVILKNAKFNIY